MLLTLSILVSAKMSSVRLIQMKNLGYLFGALALAYSICSPLVAFAAKRVPVRYLTFISFGVATLGTFLMGPSKLLGDD